MIHLERALDLLPQQGDRDPWRLRQNYLYDVRSIRRDRIDDGVLAFAVSLASATGLWLATPYLLLERRIQWRRLIPTGLITAVALNLFGVGSALVMPHALGSAANEHARSETSRLARQLGGRWR